MTNQYNGTLFIISAASGSGKTSLLKAVLNDIPNLILSISHTTRAPRASEQSGIDYFFITREQFNKMRENSDFLETATIFDNFYGTSKQFVLEYLNQGKDVILEIDYQGAMQIMTDQASNQVSDMSIVSIFIVPPSLQALEQRLTCRNQDSDLVIKQRLASAKIEIQHYFHYDYLIINDDFKEAVKNLSTIINAKRLTVAKQKILNQNLINKLID